MLVDWPKSLAARFGISKLPKPRLNFLKIATAPGEVLSDSAEGFTVLLQASLQPLLCLRSLIQSAIAR